MACGKLDFFLAKNSFKFSRLGVTMYKMRPTMRKKDVINSDLLIIFLAMVMIRTGYDE